MRDLEQQFNGEFIFVYVNALELPDAKQLFSAVFTDLAPKLGKRIPRAISAT